TYVRLFCMRRGRVRTLAVRQICREQIWARERSDGGQSPRRRTRRVHPFFYLIGLPSFTQISLIVRNLPLISYRNQGRRNNKVSGSRITGNRNIPNRSNTQQGFNIGVVRHRFEGVPKENKDIHFALGYF